jgi:hypothetical protein
MNELHTHIQYIYIFRVLVLKVVVIYSKPSLIIILKNLNACLCHTSSLTHGHHGVNYMNISMNL